MKTHYYLAIAIISMIVHIPLCAMRTSCTKRESMQARAIALKQARKDAQLFSRLNRKSSDAKPKVSAYDNPCKLFGLSGLDALPDALQPQEPQCRFVTFRGRGAQQLAMLAMIACLLVPTACAADAEPRALPALAKVEPQTFRSLALAGTMAPLSLVPGAGMVMTMARLQADLHAFDGLLNGKLGGGADNFGRLIHEYHEYESTDPVKAKAALSGAMVLAAGAIGFIIGGLETLPIGGAGAIPVALAALSTALRVEAVGIVVGAGIEQIDKVADHKIVDWLHKGMQGAGPVVIYLDHQLSDEQAFNWVQMFGLAGVVATHFTPIINRLSCIDLTIFKSGLHAIRMDVEQASLRSLRQEFVEQLETPLEGAVEHGSLHNVEHAVMSVEREQPIQKMALMSQASIALQPTIPLKKFEKVEAYDFMGDGKRAFERQAFEQWKAAAPGALRLPTTHGLELVNQYLREEMARPAWSLEGAAANAYFNEQNRRKHFGF